MHTIAQGSPPPFGNLPEQPPHSVFTFGCGCGDSLSDRSSWTSARASPTSWTAVIIVQEGRDTARQRGLIMETLSAPALGICFFSVELCDHRDTGTRVVFSVLSVGGMLVNCSDPARTTPYIQYASKCLFRPPAGVPLDA
jgi:hypothetical protein